MQSLQNNNQGGLQMLKKNRGLSLLFKVKVITYDAQGNLRWGFSY
jgi:hypothetical protein